MKHLEGIGHRIELVKKHFNFTNEGLGKVCGVSYAAIAKIINGGTKDPSVSLFMHISQKLKVNISWLLFNQGEMLEESSKVKKIDNSTHVEALKAKNKSLELLVRSKNGEIETLKKIINLMEISKINRKKAS